MNRTVAGILVQLVAQHLASRPEGDHQWLPDSPSPVATAAVLTIPALLIDHPATEMLNWAIWPVFAAEYAILWPQRRWRSGWFDAAIVVVSFPLLTGLLELARILRLVALVRAWPFVELLRRRGGGWVLTVLAAIAVAATSLFALFEGHSWLDSARWRLVTITTVGYGDISPTTTQGRLTAGMLMMVGIGLVGYITANIAAWFVQSETVPAHPHRAMPEACEAGHPCCPQCAANCPGV